MAPKVEEEDREEAPSANGNGQQQQQQQQQAPPASPPTPAAPVAAPIAAPPAPNTPPPPTPQPAPLPPPTTIKRVVAALPAKEELVAVTPNQRNWRGILIALLVIVAVLALIVFSIVLLSPPDEGPRVRGFKFSLEDIVGDAFQPRRFNGSWASETELAFLDVWGGVSLLNAENLTTREIVRNTTMHQSNADAFSISADMNYVLLESSEKMKKFAHSYEAHYFIYNVHTQMVDPLTPGHPASPDDAPPLQFVTWSPRGSALAFVYGNDIYYRPSATGDTYRVTYTGRPNIIFNGVPDWLYEVEVLRSRRALWFSPDGRALLFATFNDTRVDELRFPWFGGGETRRTPYPELRSLRYPRAGRPNPDVTLHVADVSSPQVFNITELKTPKEVQQDGEHYVLAVNWAPQRRVAVAWSNRRQNVTLLTLCHAKSALCHKFHEEKAQTRERDEKWVASPGTPLVAADGNSMLAVLPVLDGKRGYYPHVCLVQGDPPVRTPLTHGPFEVTRILRWDEENHFVYFLAAPTSKPGQRHLYRVRDEIAGATQARWECLTCPAPDPPRPRVPFRPLRNMSHDASDLFPRCLFADALLSPGGSPAYAVVECLGPDVPIDALADVARNFSLLAVLDWRHELRERWNNMSTPQVKTFAVELNDSLNAQVRLFLPQGLREYEEMLFPLVLHVSAEPGSQLVSERWRVDWGTYLVSQRNFIVAQIDGRGSGYQGNRLRQRIYHHLGSVDVEDQIAVIKWLRDNLKFVDRDHIGVWGWRYGGFATTMILSKDTDVFKCGAAVAPISSWAEYNSAFTERYMGTPNLTDNYRGYDESDVTKRAGNLNNKLFLLIHGTADDTVHYQQSMLLVKALAKEGVLFRHQTYPDEGNTLDGVQHHLYKVMESFFDDCFGPLDFAEWEIGTSFFNFKQ